MKIIKLLLLGLILLLVSGCTNTSIAVIDEPLNVTIVSPIDEVSESLMTIQFEHHEIHEGNHFFINGFENIDLDEEIVFGVITTSNDTVAHVTTQIEGTSQIEIYIYENSNFSNGTIVEPINNNRNSNKTSITSLFLTPNVTGLGDLLSVQSSGKTGANPQKASGGISKRESEILLRINTSYIFKTISRDNDNIITFRAEWYEHPRDESD